MTIRKQLAALCLLAAVPAAPLAAQGAFDNEAELTSFSVENIQPAMRAAGATSLEAVTDEDGDRYLRASFEGGRVVLATPRACSEEGSDCLGLSLRTFWRPVTPLSDMQIEAAIAAFNNNAVSQGLITDDGVVVLSYYLIGDYGLPQGNVRVATEVFLGNLDALRAATTQG